MATNDILQFADSVAGGDIWNDAQYLASTVRTGGNTAGSEASRRDINKVLLQCSTMVSGLAQYIADLQAANINDALTPAQISQYMKSSVHNSPLYFATAGGSADVITATFSPAMTALADGAGLIVVKAVSPNATTTPTLNCNALGAKTIVKSNGLALGIGDIVANYYMLLTYDAGQDKYVLNNPAGGQAVDIGYVMHVRHEEADNVDGGTFTAGSWQTRTLNTELTNTIAGASLAADQITLPAGTYEISAWATGFNVNQHQTQIYDTTGTATLIIGSSANTNVASTGTQSPISTVSTCYEIVTLAVESVLELRHRCDDTQANTGFGYPCGFGIGEVYADVVIKKL